MDWPRRPADAAPPPPGGCGMHRSALHSARDVKSGRAGRAPGRDIPAGRPVRRRAAVRRQARRPGTGGRHDRGACAGRPPPAGRASRGTGRGGGDRGDLHPGRAAADPRRGPGCPGPAAARPGDGAGQRSCRERADLKSAAKSRYHRGPGMLRASLLPARDLRGPRPASRCTGRTSDDSKQPSRPSAPGRPAHRRLRDAGSERARARLTGTARCGRFRPRSTGGPPAPPVPVTARQTGTGSSPCAAR